MSDDAIAPQSRTGEVPMAAVVVSIREEGSVPEPTDTAFRWGVICAKPQDGELAAGLLVTTATGDLEKYCDEHEQLALLGEIAGASCLLYNLPLSQALKAAEGRVDTLLILPSAVDWDVDRSAFSGALFMQSPLYGERVKAWAMRAGNGAILDDHQGKGVYILASFLALNNSLPAIGSIRRDGFSGVSDVALASILADMGVSYFFKASDVCYLDAFRIGGLPAQIFYTERMLKRDLSRALAPYFGKPLSAATLGAMQSGALAVLALYKNRSLIDAIGHYDALGAAMAEGVSIAVTDATTGVVSLSVAYVSMGIVRRVAVTVGRKEQNND